MQNTVEFFTFVGILHGSCILSTNIRNVGAVIILLYICIIDSIILSVLLNRGRLLKYKDTQVPCRLTFESKVHAIKLT